MRYRSPIGAMSFRLEYSLASPPRRTRLSSASLMLQPTTSVRRAKLSEWQPGTFSSVSLQGVTPVFYLYV
jgi:hypothetical protein